MYISKIFFFFASENKNYKLMKNYFISINGEFTKDFLGITSAKRHFLMCVENAIIKDVKGCEILLINKEYETILEFNS